MTHRIDISHLFQRFIEPQLGEIDARHPRVDIMIDGVNSIITHSTFNSCALADLVIAELEGSSQ